MLVLSRKLNESIQIGDNIVITVVQNRAGKVRLGVKAPRDVNVVRSELLIDLTIEPVDENSQRQVA